MVKATLLGAGVHLIKMKVEGQTDYALRLDDITPPLDRSGVQ